MKSAGFDAVMQVTLPSLLLYYCFTTALLLLYHCFTTAFYIAHGGHHSRRALRELDHATPDIC